MQAVLYYVVSGVIGLISRLEIIILILCYVQEPVEQHTANTGLAGPDHLTKDKSEVSFLEVEWVIT